MKINYIWVTFIVAVIVLLLFQFFWLHNMYHIQKTDLEERLNVTLVEAVQKELDKRFLYSDQQLEKSPEKEMFLNILWIMIKCRMKDYFLYKMRLCNV